MLYNKLRADLLIARKNKNTTEVSFLSTLVGECDAIGKKENREPTKDECIKVIKKFKACAIECSKMTTNQDFLNRVENEIQFLQKYLSEFEPKQLTENDIRNEIGKLLIVRRLLTIGETMKHFSSTFEKGSYDGKKVTEIFKEMIK